MSGWHGNNITGKAAIWKRLLNGMDFLFILSWKVTPKREGIVQRFIDLV